MKQFLMTCPSSAVAHLVFLSGVSYGILIVVAPNVVLEVSQSCNYLSITHVPVGNLSESNGSPSWILSVFI